MQDIIEFKENDAENLDLANLSFDAALCRLGLMLFPNLDAATRKIYSSLVSGGRFAAAVWADATKVPINAVAPNPVTNADFTDTLAAILSKPAKFTIPSFIVEKGFGELANAVLLISTRVVPTRLLQTGYQFRFSDLESALRQHIR